MSALDTTPSSYLPPFVNNRPVIPQMPVQNTPYTPALKLKRTIEYVQGMNGAMALDLAPDSSMLALDQENNLIWVIATDQNGSKSLVKAFHIGEEYIPPKPVTMEDLMSEIRDMKSRVINLEEERANGEHYRQPAIQDKSYGAIVPAGNGSNAGSPNGKSSSIDGSKRLTNEAGS